MIATGSEIAEGVVLAASALPALALAGGCAPGVRRAAPAIVSASVTLLTVAVVATAAHAIAVLALGRVPDDDERTFVAPSYLAVALAALAFAPVRRRASAVAGRWVFGARRRPEDAGRTLTARAAEGARSSGHAGPTAPCLGDISPARLARACLARCRTSRVMSRG